MAPERPDLCARARQLRDDRDARLLRRQRRTVLRRDGMRCEVEDGGGSRWLLNFCGNDYLGLSQHFAVSGALQDAAATDGVGSGGSHLVCGHHARHVALEREIADWLQVPAALVSPLLATRRPSQSFAAVLLMVFTIVGLMGLFHAPLGSVRSCSLDQCSHVSAPYEPASPRSSSRRPTTTAAAWKA